jgi:hypothetical protein
MQHAIYWGRLKKSVEWSLKTWLAPWAYIASVLYHDWFWYPIFGRGRVRAAMHSPWGRLFHNWEQVRADEKGFQEVGEARGKLVRSFGRVMLLAWRILVTCIKEAPEVALRKRRISPRL